MKKSLLVLSLLTISITANELEWVEEQVKAIKPKRDSINNAKLTALHSPFIFLEKNKIKLKDDEKQNNGIKTVAPKVLPESDIKPVAAEKKEALEVYAIINQSALIGRQWYKTNDNVRGYKVKSIGFKSVTLVKKNKELVLTTNVSNSNIKFNNK